MHVDEFDKKAKPRRIVSEAVIETQSFGCRRTISCKLQISNLNLNFKIDVSVFKMKLISKHIDKHGSVGLFPVCSMPNLIPDRFL